MPFHTKQIPVQDKQKRPVTIITEVVLVFLLLTSSLYSTTEEDIIPTSLLITLKTFSSIRQNRNENILW